mmetsp:Transcript_5392/g.16012  ORF Transcript_5392/g.16012 Transcript_5392/m.16012 type:complete len:204 (-) Transcript_5392:628-1239(-)
MRRALAQQLLETDAADVPLLLHDHGVPLQPAQQPGLEIRSLANDDAAEALAADDLPRRLRIIILLRLLLLLLAAGATKLLFVAPLGRRQWQQLHLPLSLRLRLRQLAHQTSSGNLRSEAAGLPASLRSASGGVGGGGDGGGGSAPVRQGSQRGEAGEASELVQALAHCLIQVALQRETAHQQGPRPSGTHRVGTQPPDVGRLQ